MAGFWRTVGGRRVYIEDGQSLSDAMQKSGKFGKDSGATSLEDSLKLQRGDEVIYDKNFAFGKTGIEESKVVMVKGSKALLTNGDEMPLTALKKKTGSSNNKKMNDIIRKK